MLDEPLTLGNVLLVNTVTVLPIILLIARGVKYLSQMSHQHDQMWKWFEKTQIRNGSSSEQGQYTPHPRR